MALHCTNQYPYVHHQKHMFYRFLTDKALHTKATTLAKTEPLILEMSWKYTNNKVYCGVFIMHHIETYLGTRLKCWACGLQNSKKYQLNNLRIKYMANILVTPCNELCDKNLRLENEYDAWKLLVRKTNETVEFENLYYWSTYLDLTILVSAVDNTRMLYIHIMCI